MIVATIIVTALFFVVSAVAARLFRCQVDGGSMEPSLTAGDRLLVLRTRRVRPGDVVVVRAPGGREVVKRVTDGWLDAPSGKPRAGEVYVVGDRPAASTDSRSYGPLPQGAVRGRVVWRYGPADRAGAIPASPASNQR